MRLNRNNFAFTKLKISNEDIKMGYSLRGIAHFTFVIYD